MAQFLLLVITISMAGHKVLDMRYYIIMLFICVACRPQVNTSPAIPAGNADSSIFADTTYFEVRKNTPLADKLVAFAKQQLGIKYKYCSMTPEGGFDCSGFVNYVFNHFNISVPRSSVEFTNIGTDISLAEAHPGDLILFTGTNAGKREVGHIGIIVENDGGDVTFIHSTSGAEYAVTITHLTEYYMTRFVKVIRILRD